MTTADTSNPIQRFIDALVGYLTFAGQSVPVDQAQHEAHIAALESLWRPAWRAGVGLGGTTAKEMRELLDHCVNACRRHPRNVELAMQQWPDADGPQARQAGRKVATDLAGTVTLQLRDLMDLALLARDSPRQADDPAPAAEPPAGGWSRPEKVSVWAKVFGLHRNTMAKRLKQKSIRAKPVGRAYMVALDELPEHARGKYLPSNR